MSTMNVGSEMVVFEDFGTLEDDEPSDVGKLLAKFRHEAKKAHEAMESTTRKARMAARVAKRSGSVQNLKAVSQPPPPLPETEDAAE